MVYRRLAPHPALRDVVESLWIQEDTGPDRESACPVLPTGTVEILFLYRDPLVHIEAEGPRALPRSYVTGQRTRPVLPAATGETGIILVSLFPWALPCLFPHPPSDLVNGYTDLRSLLSAGDVDRLEESLTRSTASRRIALVQEFLAKRLRGAGPDPRIRRAAQRLADGGAPPEMGGLARELGWSPRAFRRRFQAEVGIPPKTFQRIMRFQHALGLGRAGAPWSDVAVQCRYADQAHLIREVREFSGRTPGGIPRDFRRPLDVFNAPHASRFFSTVYL